MFGPQRYSVSSLGWDSKHSKEFEQLQGHLRSAVKIGHRGKSMQFCIFTGVSDCYWPGVATQCFPGEFGKDISEQCHHPHAFLSGEFTVPELARKTYESELSNAWTTFYFAKNCDFSRTIEIYCSVTHVLL